MTKPPTRPDLPPLEVDLLLNSVDQALDLVLAKRAEDGARELLYGLRRAEVDQEAGEPWAGEMVKRWRDALTQFCFQHRIRIEKLEV